MPNFISSIEGLKIHDASAIHDISANKRTYTVNIGNAGSALSTSKQIDIPSDVNTILNNLTTNLILKDVSVTPDIDVYNKVEMDDQMGEIRTRQSLVESGVGDVPEYDPYNIYEYDQLMKKDGLYYRCIVPQTQGVWNPAEWAKTSLFNEISAIRGVQPNIERVTVKVSVSRGDGIVAGTQISLIFDSTTGKPTQTVTLDSTGIVTFFINHGDTYYIAASGIIGYITPESPVYTAELPKREIYLVYRMHASAGVFIIDENGLETPYEDWDENRTDGRYVRLINSILCPGPEYDNSIVISRYWNMYQADLIWQIEKVQIPLLPYITNETQLKNDYNGRLNSSLAIQGCITPNAEGKTLIDIYNESHEKQVTINEYLPAIMYCYNKTENFLGTQVHGYLPSGGQFEQIRANFTDINNALQKIGSVKITNIGSPFHFTSNQKSYDIIWFTWGTGFGGDYDGSKTYSRRVFMLFDI